MDSSRIGEGKRIELHCFFFGRITEGTTLVIFKTELASAPFQGPRLE